MSDTGEDPPAGQRTVSIVRKYDAEGTLTSETTTTVVTPDKTNEPPGQYL